MGYQYLIYETQGPLGVVSVNRPEALNALNQTLYRELHDLFQQIEEDREIGAVVLTGSGEKAFVAGADIADMRPRSTVEIQGFLDVSRMAFDRIHTMSKPVIAAVNGFALGGGCELAICCDFRIASEKAKFGQPEINLGIIPGGGGTQRLQRLIGMAWTKELVFTGEIIDARKALSIGLVNKVVPADRLMDEAKGLAALLLGKSRVILALAKKAINTGANTDLASGLDVEAQCFALCFGTRDQKEGMAAFLEKRKPVFTGA